MKGWQARVLILAAVGWATATLPTLADRARPDLDRSLSPYFFIEGQDVAVDSMPLESTDVAIEVVGVIAEVRVRQTYTNHGTVPLNARYVFPASTRAAVHGMRMIIGDHVIDARIEERKKARRQYEQARQAGKSASLLEQQRPNVFTMRVANVMPQDRIEVELRYSELLVPTDGVYEFVYPTVVGPRCASNAGGGDHDQWLASAYLRAGTATPSRFGLDVRLSTGIPLRDLMSPSHMVAIEWNDADEAHVSLDPLDELAGNRDFILRYRLAGDAIAEGLVLHRGEDENFFLLMVQPPARVTEVDLPAREYIFVVDVSGSMDGFPLETSKRLLRDLVSGMRPEDSFNVILFAGSHRLMAPRSVPASPENVAAAIDTIDRQRGGGGTELLAAVRGAMALESTPDTARSIVIVTDGFVAADKGVFRHIHENLGQASVFAFGIGSSVNRDLIEGIARAGAGEPFVVTEPGEAPEQASRFRRYIGYPVLTGIRVEAEGFDAYELEPGSFPDLLAERPLIVQGKWRGTARGALRVSGTSGFGPYERAIDVHEASDNVENPSLEFLWARARLKTLSSFSQGRGEDELREEITQLGLTHDLLTRYTSFVAVHSQVRNQGPPAEDVDQPLPLPHGVSNLAVGSEPDSIVLMALVLLGIGWIQLYRLRAGA